MAIEESYLRIGVHLHLYRCSGEQVYIIALREWFSRKTKMFRIRPIQKDLAVFLSRICQTIPRRQSVVARKGVVVTTRLPDRGPPQSLGVTSSPNLYFSFFGLLIVQQSSSLPYDQKAKHPCCNISFNSPSHKIIVAVLESRD